MNYNWNPLSQKRPTKADFNPNLGNLDEQSAWREFGGKSLDQAYKHFLTHPFSYQEDFMFMGPSAFLYYFPVIERFLASIPLDTEFPDLTAHILAKGIQIQLEHSAELRGNAGLRSRILALSDAVIAQVAQLAEAAADQAYVSDAWTQLRHDLTSICI